MTFDVARATPRHRRVASQVWLQLNFTCHRLIVHLHLHLHTAEWYERPTLLLTAAFWTDASCRRMTANLCATS